MTPTQSDPWLPSSDQITMATERAILAALDTDLLLAERVLQAEHADSLSEKTSDEPSPPHLALAKSILIMTRTLRELIASYEAVIAYMLGDD